MNEKIREKTIDHLYTDFQRNLNALEDKRDAINRDIGNIDESQSLLDDIYTEMRWIFREISDHCDEESFLTEMDGCEDDFYYCRRIVENELEEKKEQLETEKRNSYTAEDELRDEFQRRKQYY